ERGHLTLQGRRRGGRHRRRDRSDAHGLRPRGTDRGRDRQAVVERPVPTLRGILLVNLGTPAAPTPAAVRDFLAEFLADPRVVELPRWIWLPLLGFVLRTRPEKTAKKYSAIWTPEGSPLAVHTSKQKTMLQKELPDAQVEFAMRYG